MEQRRIARGGIIFAKGDADTGLMGVLAGSVKISVASAKGRNIVLNIIHAGGVFGEMSLLDGHPRPTDATAMTNCELVVIEHQDFMPFLRSEPDLGVQFIEILCARLRRISEQVQDRTFLDLPTKLARTLLRLTAASAPTGKVAITQHEISQYHRPIARGHQQAATSVGQARMDTARTGPRFRLAVGKARRGRGRRLGDVY